MPILLQVNELSKEYGGRKIFSGLSFVVSEKQKIGVIGRNGAGKSTLFRLICGLEEADSGRLLIHEEATIGYLKQHDDWQGSESGLEYLMRLSGRPEWRARQVASRFELDANKLAQEAASLSGGWRMRLKLSAMLLQEPNLFLLDEPSNYLDLHTLLLLEKYLDSYNGSFLIISHDRAFLKRTCRETLEISSSGCYHYPGDIESYLAFKARKLASLMKANESLERQEQHWQEFIDRFRYKASKAKQAQALIRKISKLEEKRTAVAAEAGITRINIPPLEKRGNIALKINSLKIGYNNKAGTKIIADEIDFDCRNGEKLALLGQNGQGKSTLIKTLNGSLSPLGGRFRFATDSRLACHSQEEMEKMDEREQAGAFLRRVASPEIKTEKVMQMAGDFLFKDEELKKTIGVLSGGERSRLLLAGLLLSKPHFLLLDEVTCHLDFETTEALAAALKRWNGTLIFASHDQSFSAALASSLIEAKDGRIRRLAADYGDYLFALQKSLWKASTPEKEPGENDEKEKKSNREHYLEKKAHQKKIQLLEKELEKMQNYKDELHAYFLEHYDDYRPEKITELEELKRRIADKEELWLQLNEDLEN